MALFHGKNICRRHLGRSMEVRTSYVQWIDMFARLRYSTQVV